MKIMTNVNFNGNELSYAVLAKVIMKPLTSAPTDPQIGEFYYNSTDKTAYQYDGEKWVTLGIDKTVIDAIQKAIDDAKGDAESLKVRLEDIETAAAIEISTDATTEGAKKSYTIKQGGTTIGVIDIPKDEVIESGEIVVNPEGQEEGTYIKLVLANSEALVYINVDKLIDIYTAKANATQVQVAIDPETKEVSASIVAGSIGNTELSDEVNASLDKADSALQDSDIATEISENAEGLATAKQVAAVKAAVEKKANDELKAHVESETVLHVTSEEKDYWNNKAEKATTLEGYGITDAYTKEEANNAIATAVANAEHLKREIVTELPTENIDPNTIYMIKKGTSATGDNYEEYMLIDGALAKIGDTTVDLTDYLTKTGNASDTTVEFTEAEEKAELVSGDKLGILIGKIKKWFSSLHAVAFSGSYNDLKDKPKTTYINKGTMTAGETAYAVTIAGEVTNVLLTENNADTGKAEIIIGDVNYIYDEAKNETVVNVKFASANTVDVEVKVSYIA